MPDSFRIRAASLDRFLKVQSEYRNHPRRLVATLAEGLRVFHDTNPAGCPFDYRPAAAPSHASARVAAELIPAEDLHPEARGHVTGYLNLGESGLAERWRDLTSSLSRSVVPGRQDSRPY